VLAAKFETGKTSPTQCPPKFLLLIRLLAAKFAGNLFEAHGGRMLVAGKNSSTALPTLSPLQKTRRESAQTENVFGQRLERRVGFQNWSE
jgi:hypothetical protein